MSAGKYDIYIEQGTDKTIPFRWLRGGVPVSIAGLEIRCQIRPQAKSATLIDDLSTDNGRITIDGATNTFYMNFPHAVTDLYSFQVAAYDVEIVEAGGIVTRLVEGKVTNSFQVTV